eukprot:CAMPEP_0182476420 /NCGR_PEP_ID=MMETSP1319-20130603/29057_1 /TAXON_ID=172717 /ORGANISM="Bolidomonas pacifica, Strain RCC208" /LENGTH=187 /DNA_ID=CAMNT_0024677507 /DNA_START=258 /DNA_END=818 /DNA_ORIENTATION=+
MNKLKRKQECNDDYDDYNEANPSTNLSKKKNLSLPSPSPPILQSPSQSHEYASKAAALTALVESTGLDRRSSLKLVNTHLLTSAAEASKIDGSSDSISPPLLPPYSLLTILAIILYYARPKLTCPPTPVLLLSPLQTQQTCLAYTSLKITLQLSTLSMLHRLLDAIRLPPAAHHGLNVLFLSYFIPE